MATAPRPEISQSAHADAKRKLTAQIHIARKDLALEEDSYRAILRRVTGQDSTTACVPAQLRDVVAEFKRLGWKGGKKPLKGSSASPQVRMIYAVWADLKPYVAEHSEEALRAFCRRQCGVDAPRFLDPIGANQVLEGLKAWRARVRAQAKQGEQE